MTSQIHVVNTTMTSPIHVVNTTSVPDANTTEAAPCVRPPTEDWSRVLLVVFCVAILLVSTGGNAIVIHLIRSSRKMKTTFNYLLCNIALADLIDALVATPVHVGYILAGPRFPGGRVGQALCKLQQYLMTVPISVSVLTLTVLTVDRYLAVVHYRRRSIALHHVKRILWGIWIGSAVLFSYELYRMNLVTFSNGDFTCGVDWGTEPDTRQTLYEADMLVKFICLYLIPLVVMAIIYSVILIFLWNREILDEFSDSTHRRKERQKRKAVKMSVTIVTVFAVCWLPAHVNHILIVYRPTYACVLPDGVVVLFYLVTHANAAIDPCLIFMFNETFRKGFVLTRSKLVRLCRGKRTDETRADQLLVNSTRNRANTANTQIIMLTPLPRRSARLKVNEL